MTTLDTIDLSDHDAFVDAVPHDWFRTLRHEAPVFFNPEPDGPGFYAVTRYADQLEARKSMLDMDPPRHDELRGLIARRFTPRAVGVWEDAVRLVTDRVLDKALEREEFDFVADVSSEIP